MTRQFGVFAAVGVVGFVVDAGVLYVGLALGLGYFAGRAVSFLAAVLTTWSLNRRFTFEPARQRSLFHEWWQYLFAMGVGGIVNYATYSFVVLSLPATGWTPLFGVAAGSLAGLFVNFISAKYWVFKERHPAAGDDHV